MFESEEDARRVQEVLPKRFGKYGLRLHPDKTRLVRFAPPRSCPLPKNTATQRGRSFDLLGLTLYWGRSRKGRWVVMQKTAKDAFVAVCAASAGGAKTIGTTRCKSNTLLSWGHPITLLDCEGEGEVALA